LSALRNTLSVSTALCEIASNVQANAGLDKSIPDQGWGEFVRQLEYKLQ